MFSVFVIFLLFAQALAQNADCDFSQNVVPGQIYEVASPADYSNGSYRPGRICRSLAYSPSGYKCQLNCVVDMPASSGCSLDRLLISRSGDPMLVNADQYCGRKTLPRIRSINSNISIGLSTATNSSGGLFRCTLTAQPVQPPQSCPCCVINRNRNGSPTVAGLVDIRPATPVIYCGGVIISKKFILTAAHCVQGRSKESIKIVVGLNTRDAVSEAVAAIIVHPNFNLNTYDYDIALLNLATNIKFSPSILPVYLPFKYVDANFTGFLVDRLGWDTTFNGTPTSPVLQKTQLTLISQSQCSRYQAVTPRQICALQSGQETCRNDTSGGPLIYIDNDGRAFTLGIASFGNACGTNTPSVNTRLQVLLAWVMENAPANYCVVP